MSEKLRQSLSAVIDDEADEFELRRVLDELDTDPQLRGLWERYHLVGSVLRQEYLHARLTMKDRIWLNLEREEDFETVEKVVPQTLRQEVVPAEPATRFGRKTGVAVAASVAFAVVLGITALKSEDDLPAGSVAQNEAPTVMSGAPVLREPVIAAPDLRTAADASPSDLRRARAYMLHHTQQQALNQTGVVNFVKMATYEGP